MACTRPGCGRRCNGFHEYVVPALPAPSSCICGKPYQSIIPMPCPVHTIPWPGSRTIVGTGTTTNVLKVTSVRMGSASD
jgi:hypothetical protein